MGPAVGAEAASAFGPASYAAHQQHARHKNFTLHTLHKWQLASRSGRVSSDGTAIGPGAPAGLGASFVAFASSTNNLAPMNICKTPARKDDNKSKIHII
eukprot:4998900-Amphidinium_carterae.2